MRAWYRTGRGVGLVSVVVLVLLIVGITPHVASDLLADNDPVERVAPTAVREASQEKADDWAAEQAAFREELLTAKAEAAKEAVAAKEAPEEPVVETLEEPVVGQSVQAQVAPRADSASASASATASASAAAQGAVPSDTT